MNTHGMVHWSELISNDVEASKSFYVEVFGWDIETMPMPSGVDYTIFKSNGAPVAGMIPLSCTTAPKTTPNHWFTYFSVDDAEGMCQATVDAGGTVVREPFFVPGVGSHAILTAADGSHFGVVQPDENCD